MTEKLSKIENKLEEQSVGIPPIERKVLKFSDVNETTKTN
jgi:hypothetical protein